MNVFGRVGRCVDDGCVDGWVSDNHAPWIVDLHDNNKRVNKMIKYTKTNQFLTSFKLEFFG